MPILSASTTLSLPAGQAFVFEAGSGAGTAVADPNGRNAKYSIGPQQTAVGPFSTAVNVSVVIASGTISYRVDLSGTESDDQKPGVVDALLLTGGGLTKGGAALTAGERDSVKVGLGAGRPKFIDSFRRPDTAAGSIGAGWTVKGAYAGGYPLPAGTDGEINSMAVECPAGLTTYFTRTLPATPKQLQAKMSWLDLANGQTGYQTFAMICTASANLIDDMGLHITLAHTTLRVQERIAGGAFVDLFAAVDIMPRLSMAEGENILTVEIDAENNAGVVHLNERSYPFSSANLATHIGPIVAFEWSQSGGALNRYRGRVLEFSAY